MKKTCAILLVLVLCGLLAAPAFAEGGTYTLLLLGVDGYGDSVEGRSDTMVLAQLNPTDRSVRLVSFLRDLYVQLPGKGMNRLNAAYVYGGGELVCRTLENSFGVSIDGYAAVNFTHMAALVDALGGVTVDVSENERTQLNSILRYYNQKQGLAENDGTLRSAGEQTLTGKQALSYCRIRKTDDDFHRTERQRKVLFGALEQLRALGLPQLLRLASEALSLVETNVSLWDTLGLAPMLASPDGLTLEQMQVPLAGAYTDEVKNGMMVLVPSLRKNKNAIAAFLQE